MSSLNELRASALHWGSEEWVADQFKQMEELIQAGKESAAADIIRYNFGDNHYLTEWTESNVLLCMYKSFSDPLVLYDLIIDVYTDDGYFFPRKLIIKLKQLSKEIPEEHRLNELPDGDPVTVYRATTSPANKARNEPSWTIDKNTAIQFSVRGKLKTGIDHMIFTGEIKRKDIIAYTNSRKEFEILQHRNVMITGTYTPTEEEIADVSKPIPWEEIKADLDID